MYVCKGGKDFNRLTESLVKKQANKMAPKSGKRREPAPRGGQWEKGTMRSSQTIGKDGQCPIRRKKALFHKLSKTAWMVERDPGGGATMEKREHHPSHT